MKLGKGPAQFMRDGRKVNSQTKWWIDYGTISKDRLFCIHNVPLDRTCEDCKIRP
jgi:hypothetical protein